MTCISGNVITVNVKIPMGLRWLENNPNFFSLEANNTLAVHRGLRDLTEGRIFLFIPYDEITLEMKTSYRDAYVGYGYVPWGECHKLRLQDSTYDRIETFQNEVKFYIYKLNLYVIAEFRGNEEWRIYLKDSQFGEDIITITEGEPSREKLQVRIDEMLEYGLGDKKILERVQENIREI